MIKQYTTSNLVILRYFLQLRSVHIQLSEINQRIFNHYQLCQFALCFSSFLFQMKVTLTNLKYDNYRVVIQNYSKTIIQNFVQINSFSCSICCTYLWNLKFHSPLRLALQIPMISSQKSTLLRSLCGVMLNLSKVGAPQALFLLLP